MADQVNVLAEQTRARSLAEYSYAAALVQSYPELEQFFVDVRKVINSSTSGVITQQEFNNLSKKYSWFQTHDSDMQTAEIEKAQDKAAGTNLYQEKVDAKKVAVKKLAATYGIPLNDADLTYLAEQAQYNKWTDVEVQNNLAPFLSKASKTADLRGTAGDYQTKLQSWAKANGLNMSAEDLAPFIQRGTFNEQSLDDAKQELRNMYLKGMFPAWADKIDQGLDPANIVRPYQDTAAKLLEVDSGALSFDDPIIQKAMQGTDAKGQPTTVPLWQYQKLVREDPRWQKTDNAYATYSRVGNDLLKMFGFR